VASTHVCPCCKCLVQHATQQNKAHEPKCIVILISTTLLLSTTVSCSPFRQSAAVLKGNRAHCPRNIGRATISPTANWCHMQMWSSKPGPGPATAWFSWRTCASSTWCSTNSCSPWSAMGNSTGLWLTHEGTIMLTLFCVRQCWGHMACSWCCRCAW